MKEFLIGFGILFFEISIVVLIYIFLTVIGIKLEIIESELLKDSIEHVIDGALIYSCLIAITAQFSKNK